MAKPFSTSPNDIWGYVLLLAPVKEILNVLSRLSVGESLPKYVIGEEYWRALALLNTLSEKRPGCLLRQRSHTTTTGISKWGNKYAPNSNSPFIEKMTSQYEHV